MFVAARKSEVETETEIFNVAPLPAGLDTARIQTPSMGASVRVNCWGEIVVAVKIAASEPEHVDPDQEPLHVDHVIVFVPFTAEPV